MKVLFIFHTSWIKGGASKSGLTLVKGLQRQRVKIVAACPEEGSLSEILRKEGIEVRTFGYNWAYPYVERSLKGLLKFGPKLILNSIKNRKALDRMTVFAEEFRPDIIHTNSGVADIGLRLAKRLGLPHVSHFREFGWRDCNALMWHEQRMRRYPRQHGIAIGKDILNWHTKQGDDNTLIYNGIVNSGDIRRCYDKYPYLLYVGGLFKEKGIEDLLEAYSKLNPDLRKSHRLKIAGSTVDSRYMQYLSSLTDRLDLTSDVEWLGERSDINDLMYRAKALVVPSHNEAFGRIVVEGMINGCLVIGRDMAGIKEQFDNGLEFTSKEIGLRFDSIEELTSILASVMRENIGFSETFLTMTEMGQKTVQSLYSIQRYVDSVIGFYDKIIKT